METVQDPVLARRSAQDDVLSVDDRDQLERAFRRLPPDQRAVFAFHHYLGMRLSEIAESLDIPVGTAKSRLHYATATLPRPSMPMTGRRQTRPGSDEHEQQA